MEEIIFTLKEVNTLLIGIWGIGIILLPILGGILTDKTKLSKNFWLMWLVFLLITGGILTLIISKPEIAVGLLSKIFPSEI